MLVYGVFRDPSPHGLSFETIVLDNLAYMMGSFDAYVDTSKDYATWFIESFAGPIIIDVLMNGGRLLGDIICAQVAIGVEQRVRTEALQARVTKLEDPCH